MLLHVFRPLRHRPLALIWGGLSLSALGDQLAAVALTWVAVRVFGPAAGYLTALQGLVLILALVGAGRWAGRWDHFSSMIGADLARAAVLLAMVAAWLAGGGPSAAGLAAVILVLGIGQAVFRPALQAALPGIAGDRALLPGANALLDASDRSARLIGPGLVAGVAGLLPVVHFFSLDALSFLASAGAVRLIARADRPAAAPLSVVRGGLWSDMRRGAGAMRAHPLLATVLAATGPNNGAWTAVYFLALPLLIEQAGLRGPDGSALGAYGLVLSAYGFTNLAATMALGGRPMPPRPQFQMFAGTALVGSGIVLTGLCAFLPRDWMLPGLMVAAAAGAPGGPMKDITVAVLRQTRLPPEVMAPAMRVYMFASSAGLVIAMLAAPGLLAAAGTVPVILGCGLGLLLIGGYGLLRHAAWHEPHGSLLDTAPPSR